MGSGRLSGRTAVITGGSSGIGLATAHRFLAEGANVLIGDYNEEAAASTIEKLRSDGHGDAVQVMRADVSQEGDVKALMGRALDVFGSLDVVFNNAGIGGAIGPIVETEVDHWDATFAVMMRGVFLGVKHAAKIMMTLGGGSIINTASIAGLSSGVPPTAYSATKAAVLSFTKNAAAELAEHKIRVNAVSPGIIFTKLMHQGRDELAETTMRIVQPWPERGQPEHVANTLVFLASEESSFVTGESIAVDGGYLANGLLRMHPLPGAKTKPDYAGITYGLTGRPRDVRKLS
ncbi:SDR family NAD(P)-dependent oxidoreductase [Kordiimonas sp.]|uniref:SDR family NAD(P)-dependent oxidoreductase n=1 Tax=Kordiimonas sp. TaxID=1970157 RepID=UPI003A8E2D4E